MNEWRVNDTRGASCPKQQQQGAGKAIPQIPDEILIKCINLDAKVIHTATRRNLLLPLSPPRHKQPLPASHC